MSAIRFLSSFSQIKYRAPVGKRFIRPGLLAKKPRVSEASPSIDIGGQTIMLDEKASISIGASIRDTVSIKLRSLTSLIHKKGYLGPNHININVSKLEVNGDRGVLIIRPKSNDSTTIFHLPKERDPDYASEAKKYHLLDLSSYSQPQITNFDLTGTEVDFKIAATEFDLKPNDIILLPLGKEKQGIKTIWIPVIYNNEGVITEEKQEEPAAKVAVPETPLSDQKTQIEQLTDRALVEVEAEVTDGDYFSLIPANCRLNVENLIRKSYTSDRVEQMSREEFKQLFAKSWVAKKRVFFLFAEENGFALSQLYTTNPGAIGAISRHSKSFIIALTISSSLLIMERPDEHGYRNIFYGRIALREESGIKPNNRRRLSEDLVLSKRFDIKGMMTSSPIIAFAYAETVADSGGEVFGTLSLSMRAIENQTIHAIPQAVEEECSE